MKQKTHRLLSLLLCLVMVLGLMPMTAFAEGTREEVDTIKATAIINVPSYGEPTNYPAFTVTKGSPAYITMTHWEKKNTETGKWDTVFSGNTFTEGTWRLSVQVRIDGEGGKTHKLSKNPRFFVNEVEWQIESKSRFDDYHFVSLAYFHSQEYEVTSSTLPQMYDITVTNGVAKNVSYIDITKAKPGDKVVLLADDRRDEGFAFEKWVVTGATVDAENNMTAKFIMPEGNVTAEATYIPCDISIKAVKLTLGNYAVGKKASDISVKIITPDVVDFSYGDTYRCYDEDGVALGGSYVLCYLEGETVKRLGADELIKEGVEYFLEVHIKSDEGYTFLGLKEENVTLDGTAGVAMFMQPKNAVYSFKPVGGAAPTTPAQKPEIKPVTGGKVSLSADGTTATITPDAGKVVDKVLVNGKDMGAVTELKGLKTGDKIEVLFKDEVKEPSKAETDKQVKAHMQKLAPKARSLKTKAGNVKVSFEGQFKDIEALGYTVKYKFYRSTKKASGYKYRLTTSKPSYTNTGGKKGTLYYYKAIALAYDKDGKLIAKTELKQCRYACRRWTK